MNSKQRILVLERYDDGLATFDRQIDHQANAVYYILTPAASRSPAVDRQGAAGWRVLDSFEPKSIVQTACEFAQNSGGFDGVLAMAERDLEVAAQIRSRWDVPGMKADAVGKVRDKVQMKAALRGAGLTVPNNRPIETAASLRAWADEHGFPFIAKPRREAGSRGVHLFRNAAELRDVDGQDWTDYEVEDYIPGTVFHVDGLIRDGRLWLCQPARYLGTCLRFRHGEPLGAVLVEEAHVLESMHQFTARCLEALGVDNSAFHLELIQNDGSLTPARQGELVFLEIGARVSGGPVAYLYRELYGVELLDEWLRLQLGCPAAPAPPLTPAGGYLMMPEPRQVPCRVVQVSSLRERVPGLFWETLPSPGAILDGKGGYTHISGSFLFQGPSAAVVEYSIRQAINLFSIQTVPLAAATKQGA
jgi:hypothetical protein